MDLYEIIAHFKTPTIQGGLETWNLSQKEYYDNEEEAKSAARRLRQLLRPLGEQLIYLTDASGARVWTNDPEAYKRLFPYDIMTREPEVLPLY